MALTAALVGVAARGSAKPGKYFDDGGLFLKVTPTGTASWVFRYERGGTRREIGLGGLAALGLSDARTVAAGHRSTLAQGGTPVPARRAAALAAHNGMTFDTAAAEYIAAHEAGWRNAKHRAQWRSTLATYASPIIGHLPLAAVDTEHVRKILSPIWSSKSATASRLRERLERILDWGKVRGLRDGENPARWRGHLAMLLPPRSKVHTIRHREAVPLAKLPRVYSALCRDDRTAALAVRFCVLTATRPGEARGATWDEIDLATKTWTIPPERMKTRREHRVPLSPAALAVLKAAVGRRRDGNAHVFCGGWSGTALSLTSMVNALRDAGAGKATLHGTARSTFRDWAAEETTHPAEVVEMALAHAIQSRTERAYRRGDLLEKRARLMADWARVVAGDGR